MNKENPTLDSVFLIRQTVAVFGKEAWYYVRMDATRVPAFLRAIKAEDTSKSLTDFGEVLHSGYGQPPEALATEMAEKYQLVSLDSL